MNVKESNFFSQELKILKWVLHLVTSSYFKNYIELFKVSYYSNWTDFDIPITEMEIITINWAESFQGQILMYFERCIKFA